MDYTDQITAYLNSYVNFTSEEVDAFFASLTYKTINRRQFVAQPDFTSKYRTFVLKGSFRGYLICIEGKEHTISFAIENNWAGDFNSYFSQEPGTLFIEAVEKSEVAQLSYKAEQDLLIKYPKFEKFFKSLAEDNLMDVQERLVSNLTDSAEVRFGKFSENKKEILNRMPQYAVASYLGFTTEYLSKIRKKRLLR